MRKIFTIAAALAMLATAAPGATASIVTIGSPLTQTFEPVAFGEVATVANVSLPEPGAQATSPVAGAVIRWRVFDAEGGPFKLRVLRPASGGFLGAGSSAPVVPGSLGAHTFTTRLPVQVGDLIGIDNTNTTDKLGTHEALPGAGFVGWVPPLLDGATLPPGGSAPEIEVAFNADVQPLPTIASISPNSGSFKGKTTVTITGSDFTGATGVSFGTTSATSFKVDSETQITATAPAVTKPGKVDISVTTLAGATSPTAADQYGFEACKVPKLKGKKLKGAKRLLKKSGCRTGKVKKVHRATAATGKVTKQKPAPGKLLPPGAKVKITLG